jgi:hypothetical protein
VNKTKQNNKIRRINRRNDGPTDVVNLQWSNIEPCCQDYRYGLLIQTHLKICGSKLAMCIFSLWTKNLNIYLFYTRKLRVSDVDGIDSTYNEGSHHFIFF